jgi:hypothetical protein
MVADCALSGRARKRSDIYGASSKKIIQSEPKAGKNTYLWLEVQ